MSKIFWFIDRKQNLSLWRDRRWGPSTPEICYQCLFWRGGGPEQACDLATWHENRFFCWTANQPNFILVWIIKIFNCKLDQVHDPDPVVLEGSALKQVFQGNFSEGLEIFENITFGSTLKRSRKSCWPTTFMFLRNTECHVAVMTHFWGWGWHFHDFSIFTILWIGGCILHPQKADN